VSDSADRFLFTAAAAELGVVGGEVGAFGADGGAGALGQLRGQPPGPRAGSSGFPVAGRLVMAWTGARPGDEVPDGRELSEDSAVAEAIARFEGLGTPNGDRDSCCQPRGLRLEGPPGGQS
jgi:hypothetical protein